jgi:sugar phosphate isomerase/epimerase
MSTSRRNFLKTGGLSAAAMAFGRAKLFAAADPDIILGIQLYTVRDEMKTDPSGTLRQIAGIGYRYVEHANYVDRKFYGYSPADFKKLLDGYNLKMLSGHTKMSAADWDAAKMDFSDSWKNTVLDAATVGQHYVISPWMDESMRDNETDFKNYMDVFNKCGELCRKSGMKFGYHNHDFEFSTRLNGHVLYDLIMQNTDPSLVAQQLDMGNLYNGGVKAIDIATRFPGRFELMHVKDEILSKGGSDKYESTILGQGIVGTRAITDLGRKSGGTKHFIVEQESYQGKAPLESAKLDYDVMKSWGY